MSLYRTGGHLGVTIVRESDAPLDDSGHRPDAELVAVVVNGDTEIAARICDLLNADPPALPNSGGCDCGHEGLDLMLHLQPCPVAALRDAARRVDI